MHREKYADVYFLFQIMLQNLNSVLSLHCLERNILSHVNVGLKEGIVICLVNEWVHVWS